MTLPPPREPNTRSSLRALSPALLLGLCVLASTAGGSLAAGGGAWNARLAGLPGFPAGTPARFGYTMLAPLEGDAVTFGGLGLNAIGDIVGASIAFPEAGGTWTAVLWPRGGSPEPLLPLPGDPESRAGAINASGQIAGDSGIDVRLAPSAKRAVVWDRDGTISLLPLAPGTIHSSAFGINARGQVAGRAYGSGFQQAVRWEPDGSVTILSTPEPHTPPNHWFTASAINDRGECAGVYRPPGPHRRPIRWDARGIGHDLETLPAFPGGTASSINNRGEVGGAVYFGISSPEALGAIWNKHGQLRIAEPLPGHMWSWVLGISDTGTAVGYSQDEHGMRVPVQWGQGGGTPVPLEVPNGFSQAWASVINNSGQITLFALNSLALPWLPGQMAHFVLE